MKRIYWLVLYAVIAHPNISGENLRITIPWLDKYSGIGIDRTLARLIKDGLIDEISSGRDFMYFATADGIKEIAKIFQSLTI